MLKEWLIRRATDDDIGAIVELWKEMMDFHKRRDRFFTRLEKGHDKFAEFMRTNISDGDRCVLIAQKGDEILGYCQAIIEKHPPVLKTVEYGRISDLAIASSCRRMGIGKRLFKEAEKWFSAKGIKRIDVRIAVTNEISTRFWRKIGFSPYLETVFMEI